MRTDPGVWSILRTVYTVTRCGSALYGSMSEVLRAPGYSVLEVMEFSQINILALSIMSVCANSVSGSGFRAKLLPIPSPLVPPAACSHPSSSWSV